MPVRINLKELFGSDSQELTVDKLNFNFNKLLELGVGLRGVRGLTGATGSLGPHGIQGDKGDKGNQWFVGTGNPNGQTFPNLMDEDFFVNADESQIWQYDIDTDSWVVVVDISGIVTNFLAQAGATFVRGYGDTSPDDSRYIVFPNRGNSVTDFVGDGLGSLGSSSNNDIFYLSNFNEKHPEVINIVGEPDGDDFYNAIQKIFVDYSAGISGRYHMEFGSLFTDVNDNLGYGAGAFLVSELSTNLKIRHQVEDIGGDLLYKGIFSMTIPENKAPGTITHNGIIDFQLPKYSAVDVINDNISIQLGSKYGLEGIANFVRFDGINFTTTQGRAGLGVAINYDTRDSNITLPSNISGNNYFLLDTDDANVDQIFIDSGLYQDSGNIRQLSTRIPELSDSAVGQYSITPGPNTFASSKLAILGNSLYSVEGWNYIALAGGMGPINNPAVESGIVCRWDISDKDNARNIESDQFNAATGAYNTALFPIVKTKLISGLALCDVKAAGDYVYMVSNHSRGQYDSIDFISGSNVTEYWSTYLQIGKISNPPSEKIQYVGSIGMTDQTDTFDPDLSNGALDGAFRIDLSGQYAIVATNRLRTFGSSNTSLDTSHWGSSTYGNGFITAVNISDPTSPSVSGFLSELRTHHLDLAVSEDFAATISLKVGPNPGDNISWDGHTVNVNVYKIDTYSNTPSNVVISNIGTHQIYSSATLLNSGNSQTNSVINKFGSINIDGRNIYALYKNNIWYYTAYQEGTGSVGFQFKMSAQYNGSISDTRVIDSKLVGRSIYALISEGGTNSYDSDEAYLVKINIDKQNGIHTVWKKLLDDPWYSSMEVSGGNLYLHRSRSGKGKSQIDTFELDSLETDHAHISNLKSVNITTSKNITVGDTANIKSGLNVGNKGINSAGPINSNGPMGNEAKRWYSGRGTTNGTAGVANGFAPTLNENSGIILERDWTYKITLNCDYDTLSGRKSSTYIVWCNGGNWTARLVSASDYSGFASRTPRVGLINPTDTKLSVYADINQVVGINYSVESTYIGDGISSEHANGADYHWHRVDDTIEYRDGNVELWNNNSFVFKATDNKYSAFNAGATAPNFSYIWPQVDPLAGQQLTYTGVGGQLEWNVSGYETLDGNGVIAYATNEYDVLIRNSDNTGYEWIPIGTFLAILDEVRELTEGISNTIPLINNAAAKWSHSYNSGALDVVLSGSPSWSGVLVGQGNDISTASGITYLQLAAGQNRGTALNFRIPDNHDSVNPINIDISTFINPGAISLGYYVGNGAPGDGAFTYSSKPVAGNAVNIDTTRWQITGNPGEIVILKIFKTSAYPEIGIISLDISA